MSAPLISPELLLDIQGDLRHADRLAADLVEVGSASTAAPAARLGIIRTTHDVLAELQGHVRQQQGTLLGTAFQDAPPDLRLSYAANAFRQIEDALAALLQMLSHAGAAAGPGERLR
jgi:hypothetical protein